MKSGSKRIIKGDKDLSVEHCELKQRTEASQEESLEENDLQVQATSNQHLNPRFASEMRQLSIAERSDELNSENSEPEELAPVLNEPTLIIRQPASSIVEELSPRDPVPALPLLHNQEHPQQPEHQRLLEQ